MPVPPRALPSAAPFRGPPRGAAAAAAAGAAAAADPGYRLTLGEFTKLTSLMEGVNEGKQEGEGNAG